MQNPEQIRLKAAGWMVSRGWKRKLAKKLGREQTLFEHSLVELDVLLELLPILGQPHHYDLTDTERQILEVAVVVHDVGKERDEWQSYIADPNPHKQWVPHILPQLTRAVLPEICSALGFEGLGQPVEQIMAHCAEFHHSKPGLSDGSIMAAILTGGSDRFLALAHIVRAIDRCCSSLTAPEAKVALETEPALRNHLRVATHEALVRGVSTVFLHSAAQAAFRERGWRAALYFTNGTLYCAEPNEQPVEPSVDAIRSRLKEAIDRAIERDVTPLMVGSPTGNILPKPDLLAFRESRRYLETAGRKVGSKSFARKPPRASRVVEDYWKLTGKPGAPSDGDVKREAERISSAQPEMMVFKFFKAMMDPEKVEAIGEDGAARARVLYEEAFGHGSWAALQSTSTLMPAKDMAKTVDYYWSLSGSAVNHPEVKRVEELPDQKRLEGLVELLDRIAQGVHACISRLSPRDALSSRMADSFARDLLCPNAIEDVQSLAKTQLEHYAASKPFAGKESAKAKYLCPTCNAPFTLDGGRKASADFIDNPQTHTNRAVSHGSFGYIMVCTTCYYERLLRQVLLGSRPAEMITLMPRLNLGPGKGAQLVRGVHEWIEAAKRLLKGEVGSLDSGFSLALTDQAARQLGDRDPFALQGNDLISVFSYRFKGDTQKKRRAEAMKRLKEEFDESLEALNMACSERFPSWDAAVDALIENRIDQQEVRAIRREVFRLYETIHLICETPNLIFIPLTYEIAAGQDESETNKAIRKLYVTLLLSLVFDCSVAIHRDGEPVDFNAGAGAAFVPPVSAVRSLIGNDWVSIGDGKRWLRAIGAASLLAGDTGFSERSALYRVLAEDPPERLARRIDENKRSDGRRIDLSANHVHWIETVVATRRKEAAR
jgi:hypothetical protein